ncbi:response regulator transcription factor [Gudongella sp. DL1XJH-153]|uniref:response regulator transcription factor n=1 Tax=Gudongella sp. DL1XJH-153 TaxID=3409804 RepID=UPI003BB7A2F1
MDFSILLVEDQEDISSIVAKYLSKNSYKYDIAKDGFEALELFSQGSYHLAVLDIMLPGIDGFQILQEIRKTTDIPVIMLTAREQESDRIKGFDFGADDYVIKPFSPKELMKRIEVLLKRVYNESNELVLAVGRLKLYTSSMKLLKDDSQIEITSAEYKLLHTFMKNKNQILTREQLIEKSFGHDYEGYDRTIDTHIKRLRRKVEDDPKNPEYIVTKYGVGYVFGGEKA